MGNTGRWAGGLLGAAAVAAGLSGVAQPANAASSTSFGSSDGTVWGTITWGAKTATVSGYEYGTSAGTSYYTEGQYFIGNGRYICNITPTRSNYADGITKHATDYVDCGSRYLFTVMVVFKQGSAQQVKYYDNPLT